MNGPKLIDEINRLFDQLVRDPWARVQHRRRSTMTNVSDRHDA